MNQRNVIIASLLLLDLNTGLDIWNVKYVASLCRGVNLNHLQKCQFWIDFPILSIFQFYRFFKFLSIFYKYFSDSSIFNLLFRFSLTTVRNSLSSDLPLSDTAKYFISRVLQGCWRNYSGCWFQYLACWTEFSIRPYRQGIWANKLANCLTENVLTDSNQKIW